MRLLFRYVFFVFFFKQKTAYEMRISDWSSDVCSSDLRGGGRSSARETAMRVAAGGIARKVLDHVLPQPVSIRGALVQMGPHRIERANWDWGAIEQNPFWYPDAT